MSQTGNVLGAEQLDALEPGRTVGRYRVLSLLGRGGMGAVYLAERVGADFHQRAALKLIGASVAGGSLVRRFRAERRILAQLDHPNIARLLDGGATEDGAPFLAMEYVDGVRIDDYCRERGLQVAQKLRLFQQVCAAVQYAHQNLVVHRDLKPSNILVTADGVPKLLDFGIAKLLDPSGVETGEALTRIHERVLTPEHASPEQIRGEPIGTASDVYSLGVLLYELLTGVRPYAVIGRSIEDLERTICETEPLRPSMVVRKGGAGSRPLARLLAGDLDNIVLRAMHKEPQRRYSSAAALSDDIRNYLDKRPVQARPDAWTYRAGKFIRRNAAGVSVALGAAAVLAGLVVYHTLRITAERDVAERERQTSAAVSQFMEEVFRVANPSESRGNSVTVREVLDAAVQRIDADLQAQPRVRATLLRTMGQVYNGLGLWSRAHDLLERAVAQERAGFGDEHIELAQALASLGGVSHNLNRFEEAEQLYEEAWRIRQALSQDADEESVGLLTSMAFHLRGQQRYDDALERLRQAATIARSLQPARPKALGQVLQGFAMTYLHKGELELTERYARESLDLVRDAVHEGNNLYANSIDVLAESLRRQYRLAEAGALQRELLELQIQRLGADAPMVARTWNNMSHVLRAGGDYAGAQEALHNAMAIFRAQLGEENIDLTVAWHNLGALQNEAGSSAQALESLARALELKQKLTGPASPHVVSTLREIGAAKRALRDFSGADAALREAEAIAQEAFAPADQRRALVALGRVRLSLALGRNKDALAAARGAITAIPDENPGNIAAAQCLLAEALMRNSQPEEARGLLEAALATRRRIMPADHWMIAEAESLLGEALTLLGSSDGPRLLHQSLARLRAIRPAGDQVLRDAHARVERFAARARRQT